MISGLFKIYSDGKLIAEQPNSITKAGRALILKSIMGLIPSIGGEIAVGIGNTANGTKDAEGFIPNTALDFAVSTAQVSLSYLDNSSNYDLMIFKGTLGTNLNPQDAYTIYELGLFPTTIDSATMASRFAPLFSGDPVSDGWIEGSTPLSSVTYDGTTSAYITKAQALTDSYTGSFRIGDKALFIKSGDTIFSTSTTAQVISEYSGKDTLVIAYSKKNLDTPSLTIKLGSDANNYYSKTFTTSSGTTYGILSVTVDELISNPTGTPVFSSISYAQLSASTANIIVDGIRLNDAEVLDPSSGMISRTVLQTPITKEGSSPLEIEYYLTMGFNKAV